MPDRALTSSVDSFERMSLLGLISRRLIDNVSELSIFAAVQAGYTLSSIEQSKNAAPKTPVAEALFDALEQDYAITMARIHQEGTRQLLRVQGRLEQELMISDLELDATDYMVVRGQLGPGRE